MFSAAYQYDPRFVSLLPAGPDTRLVKAGSIPHTAAGFVAGLIGSARTAFAVFPVFVPVFARWITAASATAWMPR